VFPLLSEQRQKLIDRWPALAKLFKGPGSCIGLDIGSVSVKAVSLSKTPSGIKMTQLQTAAFPPGSDQTQRAQVIQEVLRPLGLREIPVVTAIGGPGAVLRSIPMPKMTPQELKAALAFEAEKYIPFKAEETALDFAIVGDRPGGRMEVLLAAAKNELVKAHLELLTASGISPYALDLEALGLANAWEMSHPIGESEVAGLVHVGARGTILAFFVGPRLQFTRETPIGGDAFTQAVAQSLQLDASQAEAIKCQPGERSSEIRSALQGRWEEWLAQARVSFDFYEGQFGHRVERLVLSGGSARLSQFKEWIQETTGLPTMEWNPVSGLTSEVDPQQLQEQQITLGVAVGLAVRELL